MVGDGIQSQGRRGLLSGQHFVLREIPCCPIAV
jgi:hypothetical protein